MKKTRGLVLCVSLFCVCTFTGCFVIDEFLNMMTSKSLTEKLETSLSLDLSNATVLEEWDTHGWFGEGEAFLKLQCVDGFEENFTLGKENWREYPLVDEALEFYSTAGIFENPNARDEKIVPEIQNGYWTTNIKDVNAGFNFVAYDLETDVLYYYNYTT